MKIRNWGRNLEFEPEKIVVPETTEDVIRIVESAITNKKKIRVIGSGHSFSELIETPEIFIDSSRLQGLLDVNPENRTATFMAGTKISLATRLLHQNGMAFPNQGDIDKQSLAGAFSTGTHGTGIQFASLSKMIQSIEFVDGTGKLQKIDADDDPELIEACRIHLGAFGIITKVTLNCAEAFTLECQSKSLPLEKILQEIETYSSTNRHFEFFWFPYSNIAQLKLSNPVDIPRPRNPVKRFLSDTILENIAFETACQIARIRPSWAPAISRFCGSVNPDSSYAEPAHQVFPTDRKVIFVEMEYSLPIESGVSCFSEIKALIEENKMPVFFPVEFRVAGPDSAWISPMYGRKNAIISLHVFRGFHQKEFFSAAEPIFKKYGGRPHWGKVHNVTKEELSRFYPRWSDFCASRQKFDPEGIFINKKTSSYFDIDGP